MSFTTVLTAEQNLLQAENSFAVAAANVPLGLTAVFRALGGGWQIRVDGNFGTAATVDQMRARTDWGNLLPPVSAPQPPAPGLPGPEDIGPTGQTSRVVSVPAQASALIRKFLAIVDVSVGVCAVQRRRFPVGAKPHPATAPAGSNRSSHGGNEVAEAFD